MADDIKQALSSLTILHDKQDRLEDKHDKHAEKLSSLEISINRQEVALHSHAEKSEKMADELKEMNRQLSTYNQELQIHIAGVMELKEQNKLIREEIKQRDIMINDRLVIAEKPIVWFRSTLIAMKWIGTVGGTIGLIYAAIFKLLSWLQ